MQAFLLGNTCFMIKELVNKLKETEHGFKHIVTAGDGLLADVLLSHLPLAISLLDNESYQARMLGTYMLGRLAATHEAAMQVLKTKVAADENWRVQEMLAKAFDQYCKDKGYQQALPVIEEWLAAAHANVNRAVVEGLRIWTSRPYFKEHPAIAIKLISRHKAHTSEYLRKSVGNALRDINRKHTALVQQEIERWDLSDRKVVFTYKLVAKKA